MMTENKALTLSEKLAAPFHSIVEQNRTRIVALLGNGNAALAPGMLRHEANVRKIAAFCYPLLPGVMRLVVKEPAFVDFVMANREKLVAHLTSPAAGTYAA